MHVFTQKGGEIVDISRAFSDFRFDRVADLSKEEFEKLLNACFDEFLQSKDLHDMAFNAAEQVISDHR